MRFGWIFWRNLFQEGRSKEQRAKGCAGVWELVPHVQLELKSRACLEKIRPRRPFSDPRVLFVGPRYGEDALGILPLMG